MFNVFGFYKFKKLQFLKKKKYLLQNYLIKKNLRGTIILAKEGVNATIAGKYVDIKFIINKINKTLDIKSFDSENISKSKFQPFHRGKVKIKKEIVPMDLSLSSKIKNKNNYIEPNKWNKLIKDKNTLVLDSRKPFEYNVGTFKESINPNVDNFREFPRYLNKLNKKKSIAMFCTGGIRCEKASVYLKKKGFKNVYQLKGGILNYLKKVNKKKSLWKGECYVFDNRVSIKHGLATGSFSMCRIPQPWEYCQVESLQLIRPVDCLTTIFAFQTSCKSSAARPSIICISIPTSCSPALHAGRRIVVKGGRFVLAISRSS